MALSDRGATLDVSRQSSLPGAGDVAVEFVKARPECRLRRWDREANIGVRYPGVTGTLEEISREAERVKWGSGDMHVEAYTLPAGPGMEDGGLELEIVLAVKPASNRFEFLVDGAEDYDWWYQPPLTPEQVAAGRYRPDNVIGSYAVYHKTRRNHILGQKNYATGKAFHVYRPKLIDAKGVETWGSLSYAGGVLTVEIPQDALDSAAYPAIVDPTFGDTGVPGTGYSNPGNIMVLNKGTPASSGNVDSVSFYGSSLSGTTNFKGIVTNSSLVILTNGVSGVGGATTSTTWHTANYSSKPAVTGSTEYFVGIITELTCVLYFDTGAPTGNGAYDTTNSYTTPSDPTDAGLFAEEYGIYATYTASGGGATGFGPLLAGSRNRHVLP